MSDYFFKLAYYSYDSSTVYWLKMKPTVGGMFRIKFVRFVRIQSNRQI